MPFVLLLVCAICGIVVYPSPRAKSSAEACDSLSIKAAPNFPIASKPYGMVASDFDHDGKTDVAIGSPEIQSISVLSGYGTGSLGPAVNFAAGSSPRALSVADFNGDSNPDLALAGGDTLLVLMGSGNGAFSAGAMLSTGRSLNLIATGDFNGDGKADIVVTTGFDPHAAYFFFGTGTGSFGPTTTLTLASNPLSMAVRDFNGDGMSDLVFVFPNSANNNAGIVFGSAGTFAQPVLFNAGQFPAFVVGGDFDNDTKMDLAITDSGFVSIMPGNGAGQFGAARRFNSRIGVTVVGDFNGDGRLDLAGVNTSLNVVGVLFNSSSGTFSPSHEFFAGGTPLYLAVADFNGDGKFDLAAANSESEDVSVLLNDGAEGFAAAQSNLLGSGTATTMGAGSPSFVISDDLNADGRLDLVVSDYLLARVAVLLGNTSGSFDPAIYYRIEHEAIPSIGYRGATGGFVTGVATVDYDRDGKLDLITSNSASDNFSVIYGDGTGVFGLPYNFEGGLSPSSMRKADLNGDGIPDLAIAGRGSDGVGLGIMLGRPQGGFLPVATRYGVGQSPTVEVADVTNDGKLDLISTASNFDQISILAGDGAGGIAATSTISTGVHPRSVTPADLNGDGRQDLVLVSEDPGKIHIYLNSETGMVLVKSYPAFILPSIATVSDFDGDGKMDIALAFATPKVVKIYVGDGTGGFDLVGSYGSGGDPRSAVASDLNGDGRPELAIANYGSSSLTLLFTKACAPTDLALRKSHSQSFAVGQNGVYNLQVSNTGLESSSGQIRVIDNLPTGLTFVSAVGSGWLCSASGQTVSCNLGGRILAGSTTTVTLTVAVGSSAFPSVTNSALLEVQSDANPANNSAADPTQINGGLLITGIVRNGALGVPGVTILLTGDRSASTATSADGTYALDHLLQGGTYVVTPSKNGYLFDPTSQTFSNLMGNQLANFVAIPQPPTLLTETDSSKAIALDSPTFLRGPFPVISSNYFNPDHHTRVILFATNLALMSGEAISSVTAQAEDSQHRSYVLPVESVNPVPGFEWLSQITVRLTDEVDGVGDLVISISLHGATSNRVLLPMRASG